MKKSNKVKRSVQLKRYARKVYSKLKAKAVLKAYTERLKIKDKDGKETNNLNVDEAKKLLGCSLPLIRTRIGRI